MPNKSGKATGNAAEGEATNAELLKFVMIVFERQNPGFPIQGWADIVEKASYSVATSKQLWARLRDDYLQQMRDNVPVAPVIKPRKKRARIGTGEDAEATPPTKKSKRGSKSSSAEPDDTNEQNDSPAPPVAKRVGKAPVKSRTQTSKGKGKAVASPAAAAAATSIAVPATAPVTASAGRGRSSTRRARSDPEQDDMEDDEDDFPSNGDGSGRPLLFPGLAVPSHQQPGTDNQGNNSHDNAKEHQEKKEDEEKEEDEEDEEDEEMREAARALMSLRYRHC
ncbi:hypothetical protein PGQ11_014608 [Apiospora arundinis]|uniref:Uncharacterized protein n=1 Tax=Apiospora arundinis TaxID=335852 RepID=A0ABR2HU49_9PEZI